ncbi:hypothetical protein [Sphingomonas colocasiae]|nr:hypothetical protein [Sphingomonas colocasiae]
MEQLDRRSLLRSFGTGLCAVSAIGAARAAPAYGDGETHGRAAGAKWSAGDMTMKLRPFGTLDVFPDFSVSHDGPIATRLAARLGRVDWRNDALGAVSLSVGMGSYLQGPHAAHVTVRMALKAGDGTPFFFQYVSVGDMAAHLRGEAPIMLTGQIEIDPAHPTLAWLNQVQLVGRGMLTMDPVCQSYEMAILEG